MELNPNQSEPLFIQLANQIIESIEKGTYCPGEKLPTEINFSKLANVSRITVRKALAVVDKRNYIDRKQGKGTFVKAIKISRDISRTSVSFSEMCHLQNKTPSAKVIKSVIEDPSEQDIRDLGLQDNSKVFILERIRYADNIPVSYEISRFAGDYAFLLNEDLNGTNSLYNILRDKYQITFDESNKTLEVVFCQNFAISKYLNIPKGYPLLYISSIVPDSHGKKAYVSHQFIVADKIKIRL